MGAATALGLSAAGDMKALTIVGPTSGATTGQSIVTRRVAHVLSKHRFVRVINTNSEGLPKYQRLLRNISSIISIIWARPGSDTLYISLHRSFAGSIKDLSAIGAFSIGKPACRIFCHLHGSDLDSLMASLPLTIRWFYLWMYRKVHTWIIVAPGMTNQLTQIRGARAQVLWNFSDAQLAKEKARETSRTSLNVLFLSNLIPGKGAVELCRAVAANPITREGRSILLRLAGHPLDRRCADEVRAAARLDSRLVYRDFASGDDKRELLQWADVVILPSTYKSEALPLCLIEGAASGCHLVSTYVGYIGDLARILNITELPSASSEEIGRCLVGLRSDAVRRSGAENQRLARLHFSAELFDSNLVRIMNGVLENAISKKNAH